MNKNEKISVSLMGNQRGVKLKDPDIKQEAYKQYCTHLAKGKSKRSWCFEHPELTCTHKTFEKYLLDESEFPPEQQEIAESKGYAIWETIVESSATGENKKANTASLQMVMRNKFGWDKQEPKAPGNNIDEFNRQDVQREQLEQENEALKRELSKARIQIEQSLSHQGCGGEKDQVQPQLGTENTSSRHTPLQDNTQG